MGGSKGSTALSAVGAATDSNHGFPKVSQSAARTGDYTAEPGVDRRPDLPSAPGAVRVSGGHPGQLLAAGDRVGAGQRVDGHVLPASAAEGTRREEACGWIHSSL